MARGSGVGLSRGGVDAARRGGVGAARAVGAAQRAGVGAAQHAGVGAARRELGLGAPPTKRGVIRGRRHEARTRGMRCGPGPDARHEAVAAATRRAASPAQARMTPASATRGATARRPRPNRGRRRRARAARLGCAGTERRRPGPPRSGRSVWRIWRWRPGGRHCSPFCGAVLAVALGAVLPAFLEPVDEAALAGLPGPPGRGTADGVQVGGLAALAPGLHGERG